MVTRYSEKLESGIVEVGIYILFMPNTPRIEMQLFLAIHSLRQIHLELKDFVCVDWIFADQHDPLSCDVHQMPDQNICVPVKYPQVVDQMSSIEFSFLVHVSTL